MDDEYFVEEYSDYDDDDGGSSSSEDEIQAFIKKKCGIVDIQDDFEDEMEKVITAHMQRLDQTNSVCLPQIECSKSNQNKESAASTSGTSKLKDNVDPDKEEKNDELLYDPDMDDDDQKWVDNKRRSYIFPTTSSKAPDVKPLPNSDAVLNCPACLSLLCLDCQRHELYKSQYRAMFVSNCNVMAGESLLYPNKEKKLRKKSTGECSAEKNNQVYNPVRCTVCNTEVAVYDSDEIYHFFNVLASYT